MAGIAEALTRAIPVGQGRDFSDWPPVDDRLIEKLSGEFDDRAALVEDDDTPETYLTKAAVRQGAHYVVRFLQQVRWWQIRKAQEKPE